MVLPSGVTEQSLMIAINKAMNLLSYSFRFGYHDHEDIKQQGTLFALEAIAKGSYDPTKPLDNFIYSHIKNRLINFKRDKFKRNDAPCIKCFEADRLCEQPTHNGEFCDRYLQWRKRNVSRQNLMNPTDISNL